MALDLQDQQELENFKYWWKKWGWWLTLIFVVIAFSYLGHVLWKDYNRKMNGTALTFYMAEYQGGVMTDNSEKRIKALRDLQLNFPQSPFTTVATFQEASIAYQANDAITAIKHLEWAMDTKDSLRYTLAALKKANVYMDMGDYAKAYDSLNDKVVAKSMATYHPLIYRTRGIAKMGLGQNNEAVKEFDEAIKARDKEVADIKKRQGEESKAAKIVKDSGEQLELFRNLAKGLASKGLKLDLKGGKAEAMAKTAAEAQQRAADEAKNIVDKPEVKEAAKDLETAPQAGSVPLPLMVPQADANKADEKKAEEKPAQKEAEKAPAKEEAKGESKAK